MRRHVGAIAVGWQDADAAPSPAHPQFRTATVRRHLIGRTASSGSQSGHQADAYRGIAQLVERRSPKPQVAGSSPAAPAISCHAVPHVRRMASKNDYSHLHGCEPLCASDPLHAEPMIGLRARHADGLRLWITGPAPCKGTVTMSGRLGTAGLPAERQYGRENQSLYVLPAGPRRDGQGHLADRGAKP